MGLFRKKKKEDADYNLLSGEGLIGFFRDNLKNPTDENIAKAIHEMAKPDADQEHLRDDGQLPWGWYGLNKEFTERISSEYTYFLNAWIDSKKQSPRIQADALRSFVEYMEAVRAVCYSKNECFVFWFSHTKASDDYIQKRKLELEELEQNLKKLESEWRLKQDELPNLDYKILQLLRQNEGILQSDFVKMFDVALQTDVKEKLYFMDKSGKVSRTKSGRSYILKVK